MFFSTRVLCVAVPCFGLVLRFSWSEEGAMFTGECHVIRVTHLLLQQVKVESLDG